MKLKVTNGEWVATSGTFQEEKILVASNYGVICELPNSMGSEEALSNAQLIANAGTTYNKCKLLPSELLEQRDALLKALETVVICSNYEEAKRHGVNSDTHWTTLVTETLKKIK